MTTTFIESGDTIYARINQVWSDTANGLFGYMPALYWPGKVEPSKIPSEKSWGRVTRTTVEESQSGFVSDGLTSPVRYTNTGLIFIQLFGSLSESGSDRKLQQLAEALKNAFKRQATQNKIIFRNSRIQPLPQEDLFFRYNVVFEYEYDETV